MTNAPSGTLVPPSNCQDEVGPVRQLIMGFRVTQMMYVAARLNLANHLAKKPQTARELASVVSAEPRALYRLLRALASVGVFSEANGGLFEMTPAAGLLRRDSPGSLRSTGSMVMSSFGEPNAGSRMPPRPEGRPSISSTANRFTSISTSTQPPLRCFMTP